MYDYVKEKLGCQDSQMIIVGRSIGSGIATILASQRPDAGSLFLVSPFTSIHAVLADQLPKWLGCLLPLLKCAVVNYFDNLSLIGRIRMPTFFLHGQRDQVVPFKLSQELIKAKVQGESMLIDPPRMTHNDYINWESDLGTEGMRFMERQKVGANASAVDAAQLLLSARNVAAVQENLKLVSAQLLTN